MKKLPKLILNNGECGYVETIEIVKQLESAYEHGERVEAPEDWHLVAVKIKTTNQSGRTGVV